MKESMWGYWIVALGVSVISIMVMLQNFTTTSEQDYYLVKSSLEASMYDAVDYGAFRNTGKLIMNAEKFQENFIRRFAQSVNMTKDYQIDFYDVYEEPPAASVSVKSLTDDTNYGITQEAGEGVMVTNRLTGILYTNENYNYRGPNISGVAPNASSIIAKYSKNNLWKASYKDGTMNGCTMNTNKMDVIYKDLEENEGITNVQANYYSVRCAESNKLDCCTKKTKVRIKYCYGGKYNGDNCVAIPEGSGNVAIERTIEVDGGELTTVYSK